MSYIDGFVIPVKAGDKARYIDTARQVAARYLAHGATRCVESWAEGLAPGERTSFPRAVQLIDGEAVVFSWMEFPDKATSEAAHQAVWSDPEMEALMADGLIDGARMIMGGFDLILDAS